MFGTLLIDILWRSFILFCFGTDFFLYENLHRAMKFRILPQRTIRKSEKWFRYEVRVPNLWIWIWTMRDGWKNWTYRQMNKLSWKEYLMNNSISRGHREGGRLGSVKNFKTPFFKRYWKFLSWGYFYRSRTSPFFFFLRYLDKYGHWGLQRFGWNE